MYDELCLISYLLLMNLIHFCIAIPKPQSLAPKKFCAASAVCVCSVSPGDGKESSERGRIKNFFFGAFTLFRYTSNPNPHSGSCGTCTVCMLCVTTVFNVKNTVWYTVSSYVFAAATVAAVAVVVMVLVYKVVHLNFILSPPPPKKKTILAAILPVLVSFFFLWQLTSPPHLVSREQPISKN